jgi:asparagine synthase (glutamine-hydrolysing)
MHRFAFFLTTNDTNLSSLLEVFTRTALLISHRVSELAWQLIFQMKILGNEIKLVLSQVLYKYVKRELIDCPKAGFEIPIGNWLLYLNRDWVESLLAESRLQYEAYFYPLPIKKKWAEQLSGHRGNTASSWTVLMFPVWLQEVS